jgi:DNA-binding winged helix-turn-helix (wHTH) protein/tetratricopeptide (TPR) repeat protein
MAKRRRITFDEFSLDIANELLWKGSERIVLRPKTFAFLHHLATNPGRLTTKSELLNTLWRDLNVGEEALKHCVAEIRRVLDDSAQSPRYIETVYRRGYRFIGKVNAKQTALRTLPSAVKHARGSPAGGSLKLVGRETELLRLTHALQRAKAGERQIAFLFGEQGIGKTSLVDSFLDRVIAEPSYGRGVEPRSQPLIARGQCIKSHGKGEAYMPILEAVTGLCSAPDRKFVISILRRYAPLWLSQMPSLISAAQMRDLQQAMMGATRDRMLREMAEALEALTAETSLILVLEDLQWSDYSTLDLISYWAQRRASARLLLIGTFRPLGVADGHPLRTIKEELQARQLCQEISVPFLDKIAIQEYLAHRFPGHKFPDEAASWIQDRTDGNPLFMVNLLDHLQASGLIVRHNRYWQLNTTLEGAGHLVPPTIQQIIERQIEQCDPGEKQLLLAASVEGVEFSINGVAAALGEKASRIVEICRRLADRRQFLHATGIRRTADGQPIACYSFTHALYQGTCYQLLPEDMRIRLHKRLAEYIAETSDAGPGNAAARLAMHFDQGMEYSHALKYYRQAADNANSRYAGREARALALRGLQLLECVPQNPMRMEYEMGLQIALGTALMSIRGIGSEEVSRAFIRARELFRLSPKARRSSNKTLLFSALFGLWNYHWVRAEYAEARELAETLLQMAEDAGNPALLRQAHHSLGIIMMDHGEFTDAYEHLTKGTGIVTRCCAALTGWNLGFQDQAIKGIEETLADAIKNQSPEDCIFANLGAARVHMARREFKKTLDRAQESLDLAISNGLTDVWTAPMTSLCGWALGKLGQVHSGLEQTRQALSVFHAIGPSNLLPLLSAIFAETSKEAGEIEDGLAAAEGALEAARKTGMHHYDAEICRLKGELLLHQAAGYYGHPKSTEHLREAESSFRQAIAIAQQQRSRSLELRAATSLAWLLRSQNRRAEAQKLLLPIYGWFTEGHDTLDLRDARELLQELS